VLLTIHVRWRKSLGISRAAELASSKPSLLVTLFFFFSFFSFSFHISKFEFEFVFVGADVEEFYQQCDPG
jgi:hypothetical protein